MYCTVLYQKKGRGFPRPVSPETQVEQTQNCKPSLGKEGAWEYILVRAYFQRSIKTEETCFASLCTSLWRKARQFFV